MTPFSCVLVGNESLLVECAKVLLGRGHGIVTLASRNPEVAAWAETVPKRPLTASAGTCTAQSPE